MANPPDPMGSASGPITSTVEVKIRNLADHQEILKAVLALRRISERYEHILGDSEGLHDQAERAVEALRNMEVATTDPSRSTGELRHSIKPDQRNR